MRQRGALLALFLLANCAARAPDDSPEAVCRRQAYDDPAVKQLTVAGLGSESPLNANLDFEYTKALHDATDACLRQKGVHVRGGVAPVQS